MIKDLLANLQNSMTLNKKSNAKEVTRYALGFESGDPQTDMLAKESKADIEAIVEETIDNVISSEDIDRDEITDAQINAAKFAAITTLDVDAYKKKKLKQPAAGEDAVVANLTALGIEDIVPNDVISQEAFDGQSLQNNVYYSMVSNFLAAKQDAFGELFYPTITINPSMAGVALETRVLQVHDNFNRSTTGSPSKSKFNKINIVRAITDPNGLSVDKNRLVPVFREDVNEDLFLKDLKYVTDVSGDNVTTAPIKVGVNFDLLGVSQTDAQLAKGTMDITDALDRRVNLTNLYWTIEDEIFRTDVSALPFSNFTYSTQDDSKDLSLSFDNDSIILNTTSTKKLDGTGSAKLGELPPDHKLKVRFVMHGNGNTESGDIAVYASAVELVEVRNAAGQIVATDSEAYTKSKELVEKIKIEGYELEAYATNSNLRNLGLLIGADKKTILYTVPTRTGVSILKPTGNAFDVDNDASYLADQGSIHGITTSKHAIKTLQTYENSLRVILDNGGIGDGIQLAGIGSYLVTPYYSADTLTMDTVVDSVRSKDRDDDIQAAINTRIKYAVLDMYNNSNYGQALKIINGGIEGKIDVLIGTDPELEQYITKGDGLDIGSKFRVHVASTPDLSMKGKIYITFGIMGANRNTEPHPLNFGQMFWAPEITAVVDRTTGGNVIKQLYNAPRFLHVSNLPVLSRISVSNIEGVLSKVTQNHKTVQ